jgi:organic radical activating enzyme
MPLENIYEVIDNYFKTVDFVEDFVISGGEPLMRKDLNKILEKSLEYKNQIKRIMILTNATIAFSDEVLDVLKKQPDKFFLSISNYGDLSPKVNELVTQAETRGGGVPNRVLNYAEGELYYGGWVDYVSHIKKRNTEEEIAAQSKSCAFIGKGYGLCIQNGKMFFCARSWRRMSLGMIPDNPKEYVDFNGEITDFEEKKKEVIDFENLTTQASCAFCNGLREDSERFKPAEQLTKSELEDIASGKKHI